MSPILSFYTFNFNAFFPSFPLYTIISNFSRSAALKPTDDNLMSSKVISL